MIAKLTGILDSAVIAKASGEVVIDVSGVGYRVTCPARTLASLPEPGSTISLLIETEVREDHIHLYGFATTVERACFRQLTTINGVGARIALALLGVLAPAEIAEAIEVGDAKCLNRAPGVGQRLAERIAAELRGKTAAFAGPSSAVPTPASASGAAADAVSALVNLGYRQADATAAIRRAADRAGPEATLDQLIRGGLKELAA